MLSLVLILGSALPRRDQAPAFDEYQVKAAFLYDFAKFVEWPTGTFAKSDDLIVICVVGQSLFDSTLENIVANKRVGDRAFAVRRLADTQQASECQILFVGAGEWKRNRARLDPLAGAATLTVGETEDFMALGGIIGFKLERARVRIQVNLKMAERSALGLARSCSAWLRS